ncbi:hypothetical protein Misp01_40840 [Microtetraspora sp. NBRC 13810]|uniref:helix-turn-helix domain-containing protein n=1 Tax=Microtetraspora sp. NBRC 13810 TaxID=3030990 RepID=UPI002556634A|nr:helix-turn-helix transcriptional regulator [Microtetraspora sp. NBRC 13810]GLW08954.1 hypothetical protein Misp01_40840 [Microtetraspora sp. NBRC 13810]
MPSTEEAEQFAARLRMLKERAGISFEALAQRTGSSSSSLHRYCSGTKIPPGFGPVHAFAKACGASNEEVRELHRLWALADAARSTVPEPEPEAAPEPASAPEESAGEAPPDRPQPAPEEKPRFRPGRPLLIAGLAALLVATAVTAFAVLGDDADPSVVAGKATAATAQVRVFNVEGDCRSRPGRPPACSLGLARDPRKEYAADNVVSHRVWHDDVLTADCVLYEGARVADETGVATTRWFRVRLGNVPGGHAWLPAVRTNDQPDVPTCA